MSDIVDVGVQILTAIGGVGGIGAVMKMGIDRRKSRSAAARDEASASKVVTDTAVGLLKPFKEQVEYLALQLTKSQEQTSEALAEMRILRDYVQELIATIRAAGLPIPPYPAATAAGPVNPPRRRPRRPQSDPSPP